MNYEQIKQIVRSKKKGTFSRIYLKKELKTRKGVNAIIEKQTIFSGRLGLVYDNMRSVQIKRQNGELPKENAGLTWGEWEEYPYFIKNGNKRYLRISLVPESQFLVSYFRDGDEVDLKDIEPLVLQSNFKSKNSTVAQTIQPDVLTIDIENIMYIK